MAEDLPPIMLEFRANFNHLESALKTITEDLKKVQDSAHNAESAVSKSGEGMHHGFLGSIAGGQILGNIFSDLIGKVTDFAKDSIMSMRDVATETKKLQRVTGDTAQNMSSLIAVGERYGLTTDSLIRMTRQLGVHMLKQDSLTRALGLSLKDADGKAIPFTKTLFTLADRFKAMPDGLSKTALASQLFGRNAAAMLPILNQGSKGLQQFYEDAKKAGVVLSQDDVNAATDFNKKLNDLKESLHGAQIAIGRELLPVLTNLVNWLNKEGVPALQAFVAGLTGKSGMVHGFNQAQQSVYNIGRHIVEFLKMLWTLRGVIITVGGIMVTMWAVDKIGAAVSTIIKIIQGLRAAWLALTAAEEAATVAEAAATDGISAIGAGVGIAAATAAIAGIAYAVNKATAGLGGFKDSLKGLSVPDLTAPDLTAIDPSAVIEQTKTHTKAVADHAKKQKELNAAQKEHLDLLRQQNALLVQNRNLSYLAFAAQAQNLTYVHGGSSVTVPVSIDGREVFKAVQKQALLTNRRNTTNGLALSGSVV